MSESETILTSEGGSSFLTFCGSGGGTESCVSTALVGAVRDLFGFFERGEIGRISWVGEVGPGGKAVMFGSGTGVGMNTFFFWAGEVVSS